MIRWVLNSAISIAVFAAIGLSVSFARENSMTDLRDKQSYALVTIGEATWFAENLNYVAPGSFCQNDDVEQCEKLGRLYPWELALSVCPVGWHLSTEKEWQMLEYALDIAVHELDSRGERGTDQGERMMIGGGAGLEIKAGGYRAPDGEYRRLGEAAALWTATEADLEHAWHRDIRSPRTTSWRSRVYKRYAMSVRCVENQFQPE